MTAIGFQIVTPGHAFAWADSERFTQRAPSGHAVKLAVNSLAGMAGIGTGPLLLLSEAAHETNSCLTFDEAAERLPGKLRQIAFSPAMIEARSPVASHAYAIVGYSHRAGGLAGAIFRGADSFVPRPASSFRAPPVDDDGTVADGSDSIIAIAQAQVGELRRYSPGATGGVLTIAEIWPGAIYTRQLFELDRGMYLSRPVDLTALARASVSENAPGRDGTCPEKFRQPAGAQGPGVAAGS